MRHVETEFAFDIGDVVKIRGSKETYVVQGLHWLSDRSVTFNKYTIVAEYGVAALAIAEADLELVMPRPEKPLGETTNTA
jgi:hypothetical protein